jgi:hypothetical protein
MRHALRLGFLAPLATCALLTAGPTAAQTRVAPPPPGLAATETWTVTAVHRVPTRAPDATFDALAGAGWTVRARGTTALGPWQCARARHRFVMLPAEGLFQGLGADATLAATLGLGTVPMPVPTQRIDCDNASIDLHRLAPDRAVMALDGHRIVLQAAPRPEGASPEAVVQALLLAHLGDPPSRTERAEAAAHRAQRCSPLCGLATAPALRRRHAPVRQRAMSIEPEPGADTYSTSRAIGAKPAWKCWVDFTTSTRGRIGSMPAARSSRGGSSACGGR